MGPAPKPKVLRRYSTVKIQHTHPVHDRVFLGGHTLRRGPRNYVPYVLRELPLHALSRAGACRLPGRKAVVDDRKPCFTSRLTESFYAATVPTPGAKDYADTLLSV